MSEIIIKEYMCLVCGETKISEFYKGGSKSKCKNCTLIHLAKQYESLSDSEKEYIMIRQRNWGSKNIIAVRVAGAKHRAIRKGIEFDIDVDYIRETKL